MSDCWDHAMLRSGCVGAFLCGEADEGMLWLASLCGSGDVGAFLCGEADEEAMWLASLLRSGCVGAFLCGEADEGVLWLVSLKGSWLCCGGCVLWFWWVSSVGLGGWVLWFVGDGFLWLQGSDICGFGRGGVFRRNKFCF